MNPVLVVPSALGIRDDVVEAAHRLRGLGYLAHTVDLYHGHTADNLDDGLALCDRVGYRTLLARVERALHRYPDTTTLVGFSIGASLASRLAWTHPTVNQLVLFSGIGDPRPAPPQLRVQLHNMTDDAYCGPPDRVAAWAQLARSHGATIEPWYYAGAGHFFADPSHPDHDHVASERAWRRTMAFLSSPATARLAAAPLDIDV
jgi:dienelactone hydrolase